MSDMNDFVIENGVLKKYKGNDSDVMIPDGVTSIGDQAFSYNSRLTNITIQDSVTSIGKSAFYCCSSLKNIAIPDSVTSIGDWAFYGCSSLTIITIPDSVTSIGENAFSDCNSLTSVTIPDSVTSIFDYTFNGCCGLTSIAIPDSVTSIGKSAFRGCSSLTSITIPNSVTRIGDGAFSGCRSLTNITIPNSVTSIGANAFYDCTSLDTLRKYNSDHLCILGRVLYRTDRNVDEVIIPDNVISIRLSAFKDCSNLTSITIPESVTCIGDNAFEGCSSLTNVVIPDSVTCIGDNAFKGCSSLTSITIPDSVTCISDSTFYGCSSLTNVVIPNSVTSIGDSAFCGCSSLTSVVIPNSVTSIGGSAFFGCSSLTRVMIPNSVTGIGAHALQGCSSLVSITISDSVGSIGGMAFYGCRNLKTVYAQSLRPWLSIQFIDSYSNPCHNGSDLYIGGELASNITIPDSVTSIGDRAFYGCRILTNVTIPDSVRSIGDSAFYGCRNLTSITIPKGVTSIGDNAFSDSGISEVVFQRLPGSLPLKAFSGITPIFEFPEKSFMTTEKLYVDFTKVNIRLSDEEIASLCLWQKGNAWQEWMNRPYGTSEEAVFGHMLTLFSQNPKAPAAALAAYMTWHVKELSAEQIKTAVSILKERKYKGLEDVKGQPYIKAILQDMKITTHPIESFVQECIARKPIPKEIMAAILKGIHYADSEFLCSREAVAYIVSCYVEGAKSSVQDKSNTYYIHGSPVSVHNLELTKETLSDVIFEDAERIAKALSRQELSALSQDLIVDKRLKWKPGFKDYALFWGRFADDDSIKCIIDDENRMHTIEDMLLLNDSVTAKLFFYRRTKGPEKYAAFRSQLAESILDEILFTYVTKGIRYADSNEYCPPVNFSTLVKYLHAMDTPKSKPESILQSVTLGKADAIAAKLNRKELSAALTNLIEESDYTLGVLAWGRYAIDQDVSKVASELIGTSKGEPAFYSGGYKVYRALMLNESREAIKLFDKYPGELDRYAKVRGMTAMEVRDTMMLPAFAFDPDGVKRYDIGGNTIEVSIAPDLSFRLFDVNQQKAIRSFPKKSDDPEKAEACAKDFSAFKKEVLAFAKERSKLLHRMHITGDYVNADLWRKVYIEHPVIRHLAQLVVWQDEAGKTFMIVNGETIDAQDNTYVPQGKIRVAHVVEMKAADINAWRKWLTKHNRIQLFEQVWEPVITWNSDTLQSRYNGASLTNAERNALKNFLSKRGVEMRSTGVERDVWYDTGTTSGIPERRVTYGNSAQMLFGNALTVDYTVDHETLIITFGKASASVRPGNREMNTVLLVLDRMTLNKQISSDNDAALTAGTLSGFTAAQIADFINLAIDSKATRCTAVLLSYKNEHFPEYADMNEFTLDW